MPQWIEAFLASEDGQQAVRDGEQLVIPSGLLKAFLKAQGMDCSPTGLGRLYEEAGAQQSRRRVNGKPARVVICSIPQGSGSLESGSPVNEEAAVPEEGVNEAGANTRPVNEEAAVNERGVNEEPVNEASVPEEGVNEETAPVSHAPLVEPTTTTDEPTRLSPADQALVERHGLEQVMGPHKKLIWEAPMNASRATRMIAIRLNNPDLFAEGSSTPTGGTAAAATQESELEDASSKTARVLLPNKEIVELRDGLAPVSVLENLPPGTELEGDKPCRIKGREGVWHLHATRARKDGGGIDALVLSPGRSGVLVADLFGEVEPIEQPDDGYQVKVIGNDGRAVDPVTGEIEGPHAPEQVAEQAAVSQEDQKGADLIRTPGKTQAGSDLRHLPKVVEKPAPAPTPASPVALKEIGPEVLKRLPGDAKREGDVPCVVPGHQGEWKLHATRKRPDGGVNALLVATQGNRVVVVDREAVELLPPPAAPPAKKARKKAAATPEDQLDRAAAKLARKFKGEVVEEAVAA